MSTAMATIRTAGAAGIPERKARPGAIPAVLYECHHLRDADLRRDRARLSFCCGKPWGAGAIPRRCCGRLAVFARSAAHRHAVGGAALTPATAI